MAHAVLASAVTTLWALRHAPAPTQDGAVRLLAADGSPGGGRPPGRLGVFLESPLIEANRFFLLQYVFAAAVSLILSNF